MKRLNRDQLRARWAVAALVLAAAVFALLFSHYIRRFDRTLTEENRSRLEEVSGHVAAYMERAVDQQWKELRVAAAAAAAYPDRESQAAYLGRMAEELGFEYIGLAGEDGLLLSTAFREPVDVSGEDYFAAASRGHDYMTGLRRQIFWDRAVGGVILAVPAPKGTGAAVAAMLGTRELGAKVQVDSFAGQGYSYIIDDEGDQVLHARSVTYNNLFQALGNLPFEEGYSLEAMRGDIRARRTGMTAYSDLGVEKYAYYRPLSFNGWTVVSIVPKDVVTARTSVLSRDLILMCAAGAVVFLGLLSLVGVLFLRLESRRRANRAKTDFLANMSHDMRTPMNAIMGMTAIAETHAEEPDTVRDCLKKISLASRHLLGLINDILDMSRIESGRMVLVREPFTLAEVLEGAENMTCLRMRAKGQRFAVRLHGVRHDRLLGDSLRLGQVFVNILTNAMKFTPEGGEITVDVEELAGGEPETPRFRFTFADTGIGMKQEFLQELFTPFARERNSRVDKTEGSGLGMAITKRIVDLMGGKIEVQSTEGVGSVFTVTLPLALDPGAPGALRLPGWRVLLVGDGEQQGAEAVRALGDLGVAARWVENPEEARRLLDGERYQAVVLDQEVLSPDLGSLLPLGGRDGPAGILAAYDWEETGREAAKAGLMVFAQKPLLPSTLRRALEEAAGMGSGDSPAPPPAADLTGRHILLAEDNEINGEIVRAALEGTGASLTWAQNGLECLELFGSSPVGSVDLILMDIQMPRMNGYEAASKIRALPREDAGVPILAMSANAYAEDMAAAQAAGMDGYLTKPIHMPALLGEIAARLAT